MTSMNFTERCMDKPFNILCKHYAGSLAYGTNLPSSDVDFRGIYCDPPRGIITPWSKPRTEQWEDKSEEDTVYTELHKYLSGYVDGSPNVLETLWVDEGDVVETSPAYEYLRENREYMLSRKLRYTFGGYALGQMKRIKGHNKWINNPQSEDAPVRADYFKLIQNFTSDKLFAKNFNIWNYNTGHILVPYGGHIYGVVAMPMWGMFNNDGSIKKYEYKSLPDELKKAQPKFIVKLNEEVYKQDHDTWKNYWKWKRERNEVRAELEREHGYDCYSADTEFLTRDGWKLFDDIGDEELATFNSAHQVEWHKPIARIDNIYTGDMYHFTGYNQDTLVTANHHMHVRPYSRWKRVHSSEWRGIAACQLPETYEILNVINPVTAVCENPKVYTAGMDFDVYLKVMGWYLTDGTMNFHEGVPKDLRILCYSKKSAVYQNLVEYVNSGKVDCTKTEREYEKGKFEYTFIFKKDVAAALFEDCGHLSGEKRIPRWAFDLTQRMSTSLLKALLQGDSYKRPHADETYSYYTSNTLLADDVQILATLAGYEASKRGPYNYESEYSKKGSTTYHVHVNLLPRETRVNMKQNLEVKSVKSQRVVCFELPNNTVITRRSGKVSLHRQCKHAMHIVRLLRMGEEVLRDGVINVKRADAQELLAIRNGEWTYEELLAWAEEQDTKLDELVKTSPLPPKPDFAKATEILINAENIANETA